MVLWQRLSFLVVFCHLLNTCHCKDQINADLVFPQPYGLNKSMHFSQGKHFFFLFSPWWIWGNSQYFHKKKLSFRRQHSILVSISISYFHWILFIFNFLSLESKIDQKVPRIQTSILLPESAVFNDQRSGSSDASLVWLYPAGTQLKVKVELDSIWVCRQIKLNAIVNL